MPIYRIPLLGIEIDSGNIGYSSQLAGNNPQKNNVLPANFITLQNLCSNELSKVADCTFFFMFSGALLFARQWREY